MSSSSSPAVVTVSSPGDVVCAVAHQLGFMPANSVVALCTTGPRRRLGLAMRFDLDRDLDLACDGEGLATTIDERARYEGADGVFVIVFTDPPLVDGRLPYRDLAEAVMAELQERLLDVVLVSEGRWWSYLCDDSRCCGPNGTPLDRQSPGATAVAAAYAFAGQAMLPDRAALVTSVGYDGPDPQAMGERVAAALCRWAAKSRASRRRAVQRLVDRLTAAMVDPRASISDDDAAELAALCVDVVVRDDVLVRALNHRRRPLLLRMLHTVVRQVPPPYDAPICATLAWVAYSAGDGAVANVALDRALSTDPDYPLGLLILDALHRQVPPSLLEKVMREAARDLRSRSAAG